MAKLNCVTVLAPAKLNLALDVVGMLPNGYHNLDMTMQAITLYERVVLRRRVDMGNERRPAEVRLFQMLFSQGDVCEGVSLLYKRTAEKADEVLRRYWVRRGGVLWGALVVPPPKSLSLFMIRFLLFLYPASVKYHISHQNRLISL